MQESKGTRTNLGAFARQVGERLASRLVDLSKPGATIVDNAPVVVYPEADEDRRDSATQP